MEMTIMNQHQTKSVFVMVSSSARPYGLLYEIELEKLEKHEKDEGKDEYTLPLLDPVLEFFDEKWEMPESCILQGARIGSKVYILCNQINYPYRSPFRPTDAFCFDTNDLNSNLQQFSPPKTPKTWFSIISAYGKLYYLASPSCFPYIENDSFECFDPTEDLWETLPPYPYYSEDDIKTQISGYAVLYGYILISALGENGCRMTAYHIDTKTWHQVRLSESMKKIYDGFWGRAIVVDNMIYAPSSMISEIIAFSFRWDSNDNDDIATRSHYLGPLLSLFVNCKARLPAPFGGMLTKRLIHLGQRDLCFIQTGVNDYSCENQYLLVSKLRIVGEGQTTFIQILSSRVFRVAMDDERNDFLLELGFSLECNDIEPEEDHRFLHGAALPPDGPTY